MNLRTYSRRENGPIFLTLLATIAVVILVELIFVRGFDITKVAFIKPRNIANVMMQVSTTGILAISMTLVMVSGGIDLSIGQMMCFIGTGMAFMMRILGVNDWLVAVLGMVVAILFQVLMGFIISRTKLEPFIVSLGFMTIYKGFTYLITNGSEITIVDHFTFLGGTYFNLTHDFRIGMPVFVLILLEIVMWLVLKYTKFGRSVFAVGGNENAAYLAGINVKTFKLLVYGLNGLFVAIATMVLLSRLGHRQPAHRGREGNRRHRSGGRRRNRPQRGQGQHLGNAHRGGSPGLHLECAQYSRGQPVLAVRRDRGHHHPRRSAQLLQRVELTVGEDGLAQG